MNRLRKHGIPLIIFVPAILLVISGCMGMEEIKAMTLPELDLSKIEDGIYQGEYAKNRWIYKLEIIVESHNIKEITVIEGAAQGGMGSKKLNDKLTKNVIETQNITFDAVSGASINTKVFQKAVANALLQHVGR